MARRLECRHCGTLNRAGNPCRCLADKQEENTVKKLTSTLKRLNDVEYQVGIALQWCQQNIDDKTQVLPFAVQVRDLFEDKYK